MTEFWVCFSCCIAEQPQPKRRRRIDRSMIGEPTNFVHTTHVGSGDMGLGLGSVDLVHSCNEPFRLVETTVVDMRKRFQKSSSVCDGRRTKR
ncbi:unnamed protein product [Pleuronectes platessa]|uniref:CRIB domain-containing protein n=1 Tax=Pleuronectes platessa TaxID=8262 RepID=A0A9N7Y4J0_PLEPL|nr:unnamed protein product [Pleuronectes platessa]